ncbi:hypothetical protein Franean1_2677 [Parafrankia sp. EAN1pec]|nr:hypothetical protein Franean1_2677 [Frankia sp. EAN1pec]
MKPAEEPKDSCAIQALPAGEDRTGERAVNFRMREYCPARDGNGCGSPVLHLRQERRGYVPGSPVLVRYADDQLVLRYSWEQAQQVRQQLSE